jgi:hypothetical protein
MTASNRFTTLDFWGSQPITVFDRLPVALVGHRPKVKWNGQFGYVESSLLGGRTFRSLEHLNEMGLSTESAPFLSIWRAPWNMASILAFP